MNYFKTTILIAGLTALFMFIGYSLGGKSGAMTALVFAGMMNFMAYWNSDKIVLKMVGCTPADKNQYKEYYEIVESLVKRANMPMPKLYVMDQAVPNAFATGRNPENSAVAVTTGLYAMLSKNELSGVIAHELAHIEHRDTLISTITATFAGAISMLANMFMFMSLFGGRGEDRPNPIVGIAIMILAPIVAAIIQMAVSRNREYYADKRGGELCENPLYLASALKKLENYSASIKKNVRYSAEQEKKNSFISHMYIVNHFGMSRDGLFSTHPHTGNRVNELEKQAKLMGISDYFDNSGTINNTNVINFNKEIILKKPQEVQPPKERSDANVKNNPWL